MGTKITNLTFYKDNRIDGKFEKPISEVITEFYETKESKWDMPFERLILTHMMSYGSYDTLTGEEWAAIFEARKLHNQ